MNKSTKTALAKFADLKIAVVVDDLLSYAGIEIVDYIQRRYAEADAS